MTKPDWKYRLAGVAAAGLLGLAFAAGTGAEVRAADEDSEAFDTKIIRNFLGGLGLRRDGTGIDYSERSPLVVPPSRDLPSPETNSIADKTAAWPNDPDVKRAKELRAARKRPTRTVEDEWNPELPDQLGPKAKSVPPGQVPTPGPHKDPTAPSTLSELGAKSMFTFGGLFGSKEEYVKFGGEPPRSSLTEPPVGYRTPSPAQPYGVGKERATSSASNPLDHASSNSALGQ